MKITEKTEREKLAMNVSLAYSPDDFPGSKGWLECQKLQKELDAFDAAHPEIIAQIKADQDAKNKKAAKDAGWI